MAEGTDSAKVNWSLVRTTAHLLRLCDTLKSGSLACAVGAALSVVGYVVSGYLMLLIPGEIYQFLIENSKDSFRNAMLRLFFASMATLVSRSLIALFRDLTANRWRLALTNTLNHRYFGTLKPGDHLGDVPPLYSVCNGVAVDNPDQRIVDDARMFPFTLSAILFGGYGSSGVEGVGDLSGGLIEAYITMFWYSYQTVARTGWWSLFLAYSWTAMVSFVGFFVVNRTSENVATQEQLVMMSIHSDKIERVKAPSTGCFNLCGHPAHCNLTLGRTLSATITPLEQEANLRSRNVEIKNQNENVAFSSLGAFELDLVNEHLSLAINNMSRVIRWRTSITSIDNFFMYMVSFVMYSAIGYAVFSGTGEERGFYEDDSSQARWIAQTGGVFISLLSSLTIFVALNAPAANLAAQVWRLGNFLYAVQSAEDLDPEVKLSDELVYKSRNVEFSIKKGQAVLITGSNGSGKTSILRKIRGLWPLDGRTQRPQLIGSKGLSSPGEREKLARTGTIMFLTQTPYIPSGCSLLEEVTFPDLRTEHKDELEVIAILEKVGLRHLLQRHTLTQKSNWVKSLSSGELQRLALARLFWHKPSIIVLDEAMNALDESAEVDFTKMLRKEGAGLLIVSFRQGIYDLFDRIIKLD